VNSEQRSVTRKYTKTFPKNKTLKKFLLKNFEQTKKIYLFS
jgi:hypothetical protein